MLEVDNLEVGYQAPVLRGVSLRVEQGSVTAVLGPNGAGKTTLLRAIGGLLPMHGGRVTAGAIRFRGRSLMGSTADAIVAAGVSQVLEGRGILAELSVEDNLRAGGYRSRSLSEGLEAAYRRFPILGERRKQVAGSLSGGEQQMLAIARALMAGPRLLVVDEPSLGLAPAVVRRVGELIAGIVSDGVSVLLVEQNARLALELADRALILEGGSVARAGSADELRADPEIADLYLGRGARDRHVPGISGEDGP